MNNFLKGVEYRDLKQVIPSWNQDPYGPWQECPESPASVTFGQGTQFRVRPVYSYSATVTGYAPVNETVKGNKDKVMAFVAGAIDEGKEINISRTIVSTNSVSKLLEGKNVQFRIGSNEWRSVVYLSDAGHAGTVKFRLRPDTFFTVRLSSDVTCGEMTFDDVEAMLAYVNSKSRTTDSNIAITRERYV
jgi:hypothetical protein